MLFVRPRSGVFLLGNALALLTRRSTRSEIGGPIGFRFKQGYLLTPRTARYQSAEWSRIPNFSAAVRLDRSPVSVSVTLMPKSIVPAEEDALSADTQESQAYTQPYSGSGQRRKPICSKLRSKPNA